MKSRILPSATRVLALPIAIACGQADPPTRGPTSDGGAPTSSGGGPTALEGGAVPDASGYFPLSAGSTWTYEHVELATGATWDEVVEATSVSFGGRATTQLQDNENLVGESGESLHVRSGSQVMRIHKEVTSNGVPAYTVDYDPGFLRWDDTWATAEGSHDWQYTRVETDTLGVKTSAVRRFQFTVLSTSTEVTVVAGTFDTVHVSRVRLDTQETKEYWFADGVGKVRELNVGTGNTEELIEYRVE